MLKQLGAADCLICEDLYLKVWDRPFSPLDFSQCLQVETVHGVILYDSRGYPRGFSIHDVTPRITAVKYMACRPGFAAELFRPLLQSCETAVQLVVPDAIYDQMELIEELKDLGFKGSGVIIDEVEGDLVKFVREVAA